MAIFTQQTPIVKEFLKEAKKYKPLSIEEETELYNIIQSGSTRQVDLAKEKLYKHNMLYTLSFTKNYQNQPFLEISDLLSEASIGVMKATESFNPKKGKFITHSKQHMRAAINAAIQEKGRTIDLPKHQNRLIKKISKAKERFFKENCSQPSIFEIAKIVTYNNAYNKFKKAHPNDLKNNDFLSGYILNEPKVNPQDISECISASQGISSVDKKFGNGNEEGTLIDVYENPNSSRSDVGTNKNDLSIEINRILSTLSEQENFVLVNSFGLFGNEAKTDEEIANQWGNRTTEWARQQKTNALNRIRVSRADLLKAFI